MLTLSNVMFEIGSSGRPQRMPATGDPVAVRFLIVMFVHCGVVAVTAWAGSVVGSVGSVG
jgi:hypothetical protein